MKSIFIKKLGLVLVLSGFILFTANNSFAQVPTSAPKKVLPEIVSEDNNSDLEVEYTTDDNTTAESNSATDRKSKITNNQTKSANAEKVNYDEEQKRLLLSLDILTKTEERAENLRKKLIEMIEKEAEINNKLEAIEYNLKPEILERSMAMYGSLRPEELREQKKLNLESEKSSLEALRKQVLANRRNLESSVTKADVWVEKVRETFEKQIDKALDITEKDQEF